MYFNILQSSSAALPMNLIMMALLIGVMYFFFIRPQAKKQKEQNAFMGELKKGDEVVTGSGIIGKITKLDEKMVTLQISRQGFVDVVRNSISKEMTEAYQS